MFPLAFWSGSIAIRYASYHFQNRSVPTPLHYENHAKENMFQWKQKAYHIWKLKRSHSDPVWWKHSIGFWSGSIAIRYTSNHFQNRGVPTPLRHKNHAKKNMFQWKQKAYPIWKLERSHSDPFDGDIVLVKMVIYTVFQVWPCQHKVALSIQQHQPSCFLFRLTVGLGDV